ncbi:MAG: CHAT domain-containing protein, partial [Spirulinaceae cyanobacterium]
RVLAGVTEQNETFWRQKGKALNALGRLQWSRGQADRAVETWQEAQEFYRRGGYAEGVIGTQLNQAQALQTLGLSVDANRLLRGVEAQVAGQNDSPLKAQTYLSLGGTMRSLGELEEAQKVLQSGLTVAESLGLPIAPQIELELGDVARSRANQQQAIGQSGEAENSVEQAFTAYRQVAENSDSNRLQLQANLRQLSWFVELGKLPDTSLLTAIESQLGQLPQNRNAIASQLDYAHSLTCLQPQVDAEIPSCVRSEWQGEGEVSTIASPKISDIRQRLAKVVRETDVLGDNRLKSQAMGQLAALYEQNGQWTEAYELTVTAIASAGEVQADDLLYRWEWQLGRLLKKQGNVEAITAYEEAVKTLDKVRSNILTINTDVQFSFRDNVEPIYREYVELLLANANSTKPNQENLRQATEAIDALQLAELENFLRCQLSPLAAKVQLNKVQDETAAIIYPIVTKNGLAMILETSAPSQNKEVGDSRSRLELLKTAVASEDLNTALNGLQNALQDASDTPLVITEGEKVYDWLIRPLIIQLENYPTIETLVFVLDDPLRSIPISVLHDSEEGQYLVEKNYAIAVSPSLELFPPQTPSQGFNLFSGGVEMAQTIDTLEFPEILFLQEELNRITQTTIVKQSQVLLNQEFTKENIQTQIKVNNFSAIHWKTHGIYSSNPEETYLVAYPEAKITASDLAQFLQNGNPESDTPISLLVLSACSSATGDKRAVLGLAGMTTRAGSKTTVATLWRAKDKVNTEFMDYFYQFLSQENMSKAKALQLAQQELLQTYSDPHDWATYILVGSWL